MPRNGTRVHQRSVRPLARRDWVGHTARTFDSGAASLAGFEAKGGRRTWCLRANVASSPCFSRENLVGLGGHGLPSILSRHGMALPEHRGAFAARSAFALFDAGPKAPPRLLEVPHLLVRGTEDEPGLAIGRVEVDRLLAGLD